jgi:hypothetical protein
MIVSAVASATAALIAALTVRKLAKRRPIK